MALKVLFSKAVMKEESVILVTIGLVLWELGVQVSTSTKLMFCIVHTYFLSICYTKSISALKNEDLRDKYLPNAYRWHSQQKNTYMQHTPIKLLVICLLQEVIRQNNCV